MYTIVPVYRILQIQMAYTVPRTFILTPSCKHLGKAIARKSRQDVARECLREPRTRAYVMKQIGILVCNELKCIYVF